MRNVGGSVGISAVTTWLARHQQVHQFYLSRNVSPVITRLLDSLNGLTSQITPRIGAASASRQAYGRIYQAVQRQAIALAFGDIFMLLGAVVLVSLILVLSRSGPGRQAMGH